MKSIKRICAAVISVSALFLLIVNPKCAAAGATDGIDVCMKVIIPSLFPFIIVTTYLKEALSDFRIPGITFIGEQLHIPSGGESILLLGLLGGYPIGAKLVYDLYRSNTINKRTAQILLGYCNNAGPAFIFGIAANAFTRPIIPFMIWFIHIFSAVTTGFLLPKPKEAKNIPYRSSDRSITHISITQAVKNSISACASISGWIIVFKILLNYLKFWLASVFESTIGILIVGLLELSNGCIAAMQLPDPAIRFVMLSVFFSFGGICVLLQTVSVTDTLGAGLYIYGKIIQTSLSLICSIIVAPIVFTNRVISRPIACIIAITAAVIIYFSAGLAKKVVEIT